MDKIMDIIKSNANEQEVNVDAVMAELQTLLRSYADRGVFLSIYFTTNVEIVNKNGNEFDHKCSRGMVSTPSWIHGGGVGAVMGAMGEGVEYTDNPIALVLRAAQHAAVHQEYITEELNKVGEIGLIKLVDNSTVEIVQLS